MRRWNWSLAWAVLRGRIIAATWSLDYDRRREVIEVTLDGAGRGTSLHRFKS